MNKKTVITAIVGVIFVFGFLVISYVATNKPAKPETMTAEQQEALKPAAGDHRTWSKDNKIVLVEYADLQCPACQSLHLYLKSIEGTPDGEKIRKNVAYVWRHFPLAGHKHAATAAYAAEAAGEQGKFFEMVDILYEAQSDWAEGTNQRQLFEDYAKYLKLDIERFKKDMDSKKVRDRVEKDRRSGFSLGVNSTPSLFLQGGRLTVNNFTDLPKVLLEEIEKSKKQD